MKKPIKAKSVCIALAVVMLAWTFFTACAGTSARNEETISGDIRFDAYVDRVGELVKLNWPAMHKVWPGYDYTNHNFLIFYLDEEGGVKEAKLLNVNENRNLAKKEYEGITPPTPEGYDQLKFENKPSIDEKQIIEITLDDIENVRYRYPFALNEYIKSSIKNDKKYYIFIDEIQFSKSVKNPYIDDPDEKITFVDTLLSLMKRKNLDICVTGSNSKMLSKDILTQFRDRGDEIHLYPLSFAEMNSCYENIVGLSVHLGNIFCRCVKRGVWAPAKN